MLLGDACTIRSGLTLRTRVPDTSSGILTVQQGDISAEGAYDPRGEVRLPVSELAPRHVLSPHDVLFRSRGPFWSAWAVGEHVEPLVAIAPLFIIRTTPDIDPGFLAWTLGRPAAQRYFSTEARGTDIKMISKPALAALPLDLPPKPTQQTIARHAVLAAHERRLAHRLADLTLALTNAQLDQAATAPAPSDRRTP